MSAKGFPSGKSNVTSSHGLQASRPYEIGYCPSVTSSSFLIPHSDHTATPHCSLNTQTLCPSQKRASGPLPTRPELIFLSSARSRFQCFLFKEALLTFLPKRVNPCDHLISSSCFIFLVLTPPEAFISLKTLIKKLRMSSPLEYKLLGLGGELGEETETSPHVFNSNCL